MRRVVASFLVLFGSAACDDGDAPANKVLTGDLGGDTAAGDTAAGDTAEGDTADGDTGADTGETAAPTDADGDGYSVEAGDCDDTDAAKNPAAAEVCDDGVDSDCDGADAECGPPGALSAADAQYTGEAAGDIAGLAVSAAGDVNGDGFGDVLIGAYLNSDGGAGAGAAYLILGSAAPRGRDLGAADAQYTGEAAGEWAGSAVATAGDVDSDGFDDMLVGAYANNDGGADAGAAYLILGSSTPGDLSLGAAAAEYAGAAAGDCAFSVAAAGDVNGDGFGDIVVGAFYNDYGGADAGAAYLILGSAAPASRNLAAADARYVGEAAEDFAGLAVATAGDVDGDGLADLVVGAHAHGDSVARNGAAYLILGSAAPSDRGLSAADAQYDGEAAEDAGFSVSGAGDVDGDGFDDLLVGAPANDDGGREAGAAYLVRGSVSPASRDLSTADAEYTGEADGDWAGSSVSAAGDVDDDGFGDLIVGAYNNSGAGAWAGATYLIRGNASPVGSSLSAAEAEYFGEAAYDYAGVSVSTAGDVNGDGLGDMLVGASANDDGGSNAGAAYLILGPGF